MTEQTITNFAEAFIAAQSEMGNATKDSNNPFFKSKYADLNSIREACLPSLNKNGIAVLQPIVQINGKNFVETILLHKSGERMSCLTEIIYSKQNDAQAQGSGITYARRYGLQSLVNIGAEDDDGNAASQSDKKHPYKQLVNTADDEEMIRLKAQKKESSDAQKLEWFKEQISAFGSISELEAWLDTPKMKGAMTRLKDELRTQVVEVILEFKNNNSEEDPKTEFGFKETESVSISIAEEFAI